MAHQVVLSLPLPAPKGGGASAGASAPLVAGKENLALAALVARLVRGVGHPGHLQAIHPVLLHGDSGCGKSEVALRVAQAFREASEPGDVLSLTASDFRRAVAEAVRDNALGDLRRQLASARLVVLDDLGRLAAHQSSQEELALLVDGLSESGGLLLATATAPVAHLAGVSPRLASRFSAGLTLEIASHGADARLELFRGAALQAGVAVTASASQMLADGLPPSARALLSAARELRGLVGRGEVVDRRVAEEYLDAHRGGEPTLSQILRTVARYYKTQVKTLVSDVRKQSVVIPRAVAIYLARELTSLSYGRIGESLGGRDHTTVMHNYRRVERSLAKDPALASAIADLRRLLRGA